MCGICGEIPNGLYIRRIMPDNRLIRRTYTYGLTRQGQDENPNVRIQRGAKMATKKNAIANTKYNGNDTLPSYSFDFESPELAKLTITIAQAEAQGARMKLVVCRALADVQLLGDELLSTNGFKNFADYARTMFGYAKSNAYDMVRVADKFDVDEYGNIQSIPALRGMGWTGLLALSKVDDTTIQKYIADGELRASTSVRAIKQLVAPKKTRAARTPNAKTEAKTEAKTAKNGHITPNFTITCKDNVVTFKYGDKEQKFDAKNSTSVSLAVKMFKTLMGC